MPYLPNGTCAESREEYAERLEKEKSLAAMERDLDEVLQELLQALNTLDGFNIPIPKKLTSDIRFYRKELGIIRCSHESTTP